MLRKLTVSNLAVVEKAEAEFAAGLNVLTGETGAGKSVLIGALELVLGGRADSSIVREGAKEAEVEAEFTDCVVRRTVSANGRSRAWVDDEAVGVADLKELGNRLVDIHGPRENQHILEERFQRVTLDSFGGLDTAAYAAAWEDLQRIRDEAARLSQAGDAEGEIDLLRYQIGELTEAGVTAEDDDLAERQAAAAHAGEIVEAANAVTEALGGEAGVSSLLGGVHARLRTVERYFPDAADWAREADEIAVRADELSRSVAEAASRLDVDPDELARMDARLAVVKRLERKYLAGHLAEHSSALSTEAANTTNTISEQLAEVLARKQDRLAALEGRGERLAELARQEAAALARVADAGAALRGTRAKAGARLAKAITAHLRGLGFAQAKFAVAVTDAEPSRTGCDRVTFVFEPNPGESARPLADIASSGEAARVMLAIKAVLAEHDGTDLLVFDEIDANIGGATGRAVGERMRQVAAHHQVIAITHLPQSAVYGDRHLVVSKSVSGGRTRTRIEAVEGEARVREIARMLGGGTAALAHAGELLRGLADLAEHSSAISTKHQAPSAKH